MIKKVNKFNCVFAFITLLFLFTSIVFAADVPEDILKDIIENSEVCRYEEISNGKTVDSAYVFETKSSLLSKHLNDTADTLVIDDKEYNFKVTYVDNSGQEVVLLDKNSFIYFDATSAYAQYFKATPTAEFNVTYSLVPKDPNNQIISVTQKLNVQTDSNNQIIPTSKTVAQLKRENILSAAWGLITLDVTRLGRLITETLCEISIPTGDSFLHMICLSVGESVSIDRAVYNEINKLSIDFFESGDASTGTATLSTPLKNILHDVVNTFYNFFSSIVILVYMVMLVYIGVKILLTSTAQNKSNYKMQFMAWVMGVAMLMFFPYVMKYSIELNNAFCEWLAKEQATTVSSGYTGKLAPSTAPVPYMRAAPMFGNDKFVMMMLGVPYDDINDATVEEFSQTAIRDNKFGSNAMMRIRFLADAKLDFPLAIIYFILIGELLAILIIYYKRVFMIAFLISIFPLAVALYPLSKIGDIKLNTFGVWFKEFLVNVFVQTFHAVTYTVIVTVGVNAYLRSDNWLFMIMCILFLFEGEKIIRAIFNVKSSMNTIGDMAAAGVMAMSITRNMTKFIPTVKNKEASTDEDAEDKAKQDRKALHPAGTDTRGAAMNLAAGSGEGASSGLAGTGGTVTPSGSGGTGATPAVIQGREVVGSPSNAYAATNRNISNHASKGKFGKASSGLANFAGGAFSAASQMTGAATGLTFGMAQMDGKKGMDTAVAGAVSGMGVGKEVGDAGRGLLVGAAEKASNLFSGFIVASEYKRKEHDDDLGITEADKMVENGRAEAMRKAAAKAARLRGLLGNNVAEVVFMRDMLKRYKEEDGLK